MHWYSRMYSDECINLYNKQLQNHLKCWHLQIQEGHKRGTSHNVTLQAEELLSFWYEHVNEENACLKSHVKVPKTEGAPYKHFEIKQRPTLTFAPENFVSLMIGPLKTTTSSRKKTLKLKRREWVHAYHRLSSHSNQLKTAYMQEVCTSQLPCEFPYVPELTESLQHPNDKPWRTDLPSLHRMDQLKGDTGTVQANSPPFLHDRKFKMRQFSISPRTYYRSIDTTSE